MRKLAALTVISLLTIAAPAAADGTVFGGPVRSGEAEGIIVTLSGFSARTTIKDEASESRQRLAKRGRIVCRMKRGDISKQRSRKRPSKQLPNGARWNFKKPLMTIGDGYCRISYKGQSLKVVFD